MTREQIIGRRREKWDSE